MRLSWLSGETFLELSVESLFLFVEAGSQVAAAGLKLAVYLGWDIFEL